MRSCQYLIDVDKRSHDRFHHLTGLNLTNLLDLYRIRPPYAYEIISS